MVNLREAVRRALSLGRRPAPSPEAAHAAERKRLKQLKLQARQSTEPHDSPYVTVDYERAQVRLMATSHMEREWRSRSCAKEPWTVSWLEKCLANGGVLYDIGANVGVFSLIAAKIVGTRGTVVAFEPGYASFSHLCDNIVLNHCEGIIVPISIALGTKTQVATFVYNTLDPGQSRHDFSEDGWNRDAAASSRRYQQPVLSMTLDEMIRQFNLPKPNYVKLDVDGAELNVLRGAAKTLCSPELRSVLIEIDDTQTEPAIALLKECGFHLAEKFKRAHKKDTQVWYGVFRKT